MHLFLASFPSLKCSPAQHPCGAGKNSFQRYITKPHLQGISMVSSTFQNMRRYAKSLVIPMLVLERHPGFLKNLHRCMNTCLPPHQRIHEGLAEESCSPAHIDLWRTQTNNPSISLQEIVAIGIIKTLNGFQKTVLCHRAKAVVHRNRKSDFRSRTEGFPQ